VIDLIRLVQPQTVFVELDSTRASQLRNSGSNSSNSSAKDASSPSFDLSTITSHPLFSQLTSNKAGLGLPNNFLQIIENAPSLLKKIGWFPQQGGEMKAALEEADRIGARCVYGDIEFSQTMNEMKSSIGGIIANPAQLSNLQYPSGDIMNIFSGLLSGQSDPRQFVESIKTRERSQQITKYLQQSFPSVYNVMITKRDAHMARMLRQHCSNGKVVAVVGLAHVEGIEREWEELGKQQRIA